MSAYANTLRIMQAAILESSPQALSPLLTPSEALQERISVYVEGYRTRLLGAVLSDYPTLAHYLSAESMKTYARAFIESTHSTSYTLDTYPIAFARYLETVCDDRFALALAMMESAIAEVFWLSDSPPYRPSNKLSPESLMELRLKKRTAARLLHLEYPAEQYMQEFRAGTLPEPPPAGANYVLVIRHENAIKRHALGHTEHLILKKLMEGSTVGDTLEQIATQHPALLPEIAGNLQSWFSRWVTEGFFSQQ